MDHDVVEDGGGAIMHFQWKLRLPPGVQDAQRFLRSRILTDFGSTSMRGLEVGDPSLIRTSPLSR